MIGDPNQDPYFKNQITRNQLILSKRLCHLRVFNIKHYLMIFLKDKVEIQKILTLEHMF